MRTLIAVMVLSVMSFGQTAKVIQLSPEDAARAAQIASAMEAAKRTDEAFREHIANKYLTVKENSDDADNCYGGVISDNVAFFNSAPWVSKSYIQSNYYRKGWDCGRFVFSEDYRFIVPYPVNSGSEIITNKWSFIN